MAHVSITTNVDEGLLARAHSARPGLSDFELIRAGLIALARNSREADTHAHVHAVYSASYDENPIESFGEWGDIASFQAARIDTFHAERAA